MEVTQVAFPDCREERPQTQGHEGAPSRMPSSRPLHSGAALFPQPSPRDRPRGTRQVDRKSHTVSVPGKGGVRREQVQQNSLT